MNEERKKLIVKVYNQENERLQIERDTKKQRLHIEQEKLRQDQERISQEQERIEIKQEKIHVEHVKEGKRIMMMDTSVLPALQKEYYECRQKEILKIRKGQ